MSNLDIWNLDKPDYVNLGKIKEYDVDEEGTIWQDNRKCYYKNDNIYTGFTDKPKQLVKKIKLPECSYFRYDTIYEVVIIKDTLKIVELNRKHYLLCKLEFLNVDHLSIEIKSEPYKVVYINLLSNPVLHILMGEYDTCIVVNGHKENMRFPKSVLMKIQEVYEAYISKSRVLI